MSQSMQNPQPSTDALFQSGRQAWLRNDVQEAVKFLEAAHMAEPSNLAYGYALGQALLKSGDLGRGYPLLNTWRGKLAGSKATPRLPFPAWSGQPVEGTRFLIWGEDGFGDQIMYLRFATQLIASGAQVSWVCPPTLSRLIASTGITPLPNDQSFEINGIDYFLPSSRLPEAFKITLDDISGSPFLPLPPGEKGGGIGITVSASATHADGPDRTLPAAEADRLLSRVGAIDLDPRATGAADFMDTAAIVAGLDCVVTVDTATAHLAGALGIKTIVLLPYVADWKWFMAPSRSPWYDSVRLVRQPEPDDWRSAIDYALILSR
jgi:hypothetical protein